MRTVAMVIACILVALSAVPTYVATTSASPNPGQGLVLAANTSDIEVAQLPPATCTSAALTVSPQSLAAPGVVNITATGFAPGTTVTFESTGTPPGGFFVGLPISIGAGSSCVVSGTITVPPGQVAGSYSIRASGTRYQGGAFALNGSFTIIGTPTFTPTPFQPPTFTPTSFLTMPATCLTPGFSVSPATVVATNNAATTSFTAQGFMPGTLVTLTAINLPAGVDFNGPPAATASSSCQIAGSITVFACANCPTTNYTLQVNGTRYGAATLGAGIPLVLTTSLTVQNPTTPTTPPPVTDALVTLSPSSGPAGTAVTASWTPFTGTACPQIVPSSPLQALWDGISLVAQTNRGSPCSPFNISFTIPQNASAGSHVVSFREGQTFSGIANFTVTSPGVPTTSTCPSTSVSLANNRLTVGQSTTVRGRGFAPGSRADLTIQGPGGTSTRISMGPANGSCELSTTITIQPTDPTGAYSILVTGLDAFGAPVTQAAFLDVIGPPNPGDPPPPPPATDVPLPTFTPTPVPATPVQTPPQAAPTFVVQQSLRIVGGAPVPMVGQESEYRHEVTLQLPASGRNDAGATTAQRLSNGAIVRIATLQGSEALIMVTIDYPPGSTLVFQQPFVGMGRVEQTSSNTLVYQGPAPAPGAQPLVLNANYRYTPTDAAVLNPVPQVRYSVPGGTPVVAPRPVLPVEQRLVQPACPTVDPATRSRFFEETGFSVVDDSIWTYYHRRGGERTFGKPISRLILLNGVWVQLFERGLLQTLDGGLVVSVNLLESSYLPYETFGDISLPSTNEGLITNAPDPAEPTYGVRSQEFVRLNAPETFELANPRFYAAFLDTVRFCDAFVNGQGDPALVPGFSLEIWGLPTSSASFHVLGEEVDPNVVLLRFQRGVMRHTLDTNTTAGVELGYQLRSILAGDPTRPALADIAAGSALWAQYNPESLDWVDRPTELLETNLVLAFSREDTEESAVALAVRTRPVWVLVTTATPVYSDDVEELWLAEPGEWYLVTRRDGAWALVLRDGDPLARPAWLLIDDNVELLAD